MIGLIVTGHGELASGVNSAVNVLVGQPESFLCVDYLLEDSTDDFEYKLKRAIEELKHCDGILILSDMVNSAPYRISVMMKEKFHLKQDIEIVAGFNLGMVMSVNLARGYISSVFDLAAMAAQEGNKQIYKYTAEEL
ncbi:MAG: PTS fructose transporter subunit IIA [Solobacterium sp.]|nr:PTS fructose transporter subunit IIA [Solobacterium sp.]